MPEKKIVQWMTFIFGGLIIAGLSLKVFQYAGTISNYPFTTTWSESFRIYSASLIYSLKIYGQQLKWPWLDPARAILEGLILLVPKSKIWMFRFWSVFLTFSTSAVVSALIVYRTHVDQSISGREIRLLKVFLAAWGTLFFLQGPIYYHVLLGGLLVLLFFNPRKPIQTLIAIFAASMWEGLCRVNWFFVPAVLAVFIYILVVPVGEKRLAEYLKWPITWMVVGIAASTLTYSLFIRITGYPVVFFNSQMRYAFSTIKLWPNSAFNLGLLAGILLVSLPLILLIAPITIRGIKKIHWARGVLVTAILGIYFVGCTYVSLRAGGGYDLHNYDSFILLLFILVIYVCLERVAFEKPVNEIKPGSVYFACCLVAAAVVPFSFAVREYIHRSPFQHVSAEQTHFVLEQLRDIIQEADTDQGSILFIDQRQLIVYGIIPKADLYQPYEKIELMEMAMANNHSYRDQFLNDIMSHKFPIIISEIHSDSYQSENVPFGYENNVWFDNVSFPILKYYRLIYKNEVINLGIYEPLEK